MAATTVPYRTPAPLRRVLALGAGLLGLAASLNGALTLLDQASREEVTTTRALGAVRTVVVDSDSGDVVVRAEPGAPRLRTELVRGLFGGDVEVASDGGRLMLRTGCPPVAVTCSARHELRVPTGTPVSIRTGSGEIALLGEVGSATLDSGSGDVDVASVAGARLDVRAGSGSISVRSARSDAVRLDTGSGDVDAEGLATPVVTVRTGSGDVDLAATRAPRSLDARAGSGDVRLLLPDVPYAVAVETGAGDEDVAVRQDPRSRRVLRLQTGSGDVSVRPRP